MNRPKQGPRMRPIRALGPILPILGLVAGNPTTPAVAEEVRYRFDAERAVVSISPPPGSVAAAAAALPRLSGTFGYDTASKAAAASGIPGRVAFAAHDTGFVTVEGLSIADIPGVLSVRVTDGLPQAADPKMTIADEVTFGTTVLSVDAPVDALALRLRYVDAERLQDVGLPSVLNAGDIAEMTLTFSTRIDATGTRAAGDGARGELLGLVLFRITTLERLE